MMESVTTNMQVVMLCAIGCRPMFPLPSYTLSTRLDCSCKIAQLPPCFPAAGLRLLRSLMFLAEIMTQTYYAQYGARVEQSG